MDASGTLKKVHPQKYYFRAICKLLYCLGMGDCWYEKTERSKWHRSCYKLWIMISNGYILTILINELLAYTRTDLDDKERNDLVQLTIAHPTIYSKILTLYYFKSRITVVIERLMDSTRSVYFSLELDKKCVRKFVRYCLMVVATSYITLISATIDGIHAHLKAGTPIHIEVTYYPTSSTHRGVLVKIFQFFIEFHWWYLVALMATIDSLTLASLVSVGFKFKLLQKYFESLGQKILRNKGEKSQEEIEEEFKREFIVGIQMHEDALCLSLVAAGSLNLTSATSQAQSRKDPNLVTPANEVLSVRCARNVQSALGVLYSIQVFECVSLIVMCLIKLVSADRNMTFLLANAAFIFCLILLTGAYMTAAGDITHEAGLVSTAIFHCGWELVQAKGDFRVLAVVAIQRSQVPVHMTAFGVLTLSYSNFISVLRSSYSFFAVMY